MVICPLVLTELPGFGRLARRENTRTGVKQRMHHDDAHRLVRVEIQNDPDWREVLAHAGKDLDLKSLVTARVPMSEGDVAFKKILERREFHCKTILTP